jgi:anti-anti-sigma regulatory factor
MSFGGHHSLYHVDCDVRHVPCADLATVGALARASLNARRQGERLCVVNATEELQELIEFAGFGEVLLGRRRREPEEREEPLRVEERGEADDLPF